MSPTEFPLVRPGQPVTAQLWNAARAAVRASRPRAGRNCRFAETPDGILISAIRAGNAWDHPFRVQLGTNSADITPGFLNFQIDPLIGDVKLSEGAVLTWTTPSLDEQGIGYIAIEVEADKEWKAATAKIVQVVHPASIDGTTPPKTESLQIGGVPVLPGRRARWPLAKLIQRTAGDLELFQITMGDLQVAFESPPAGTDPSRAFFW